MAGDPPYRLPGPRLHRRKGGSQGGAVDHVQAYAPLSVSGLCRNLPRGKSSQTGPVGGNAAPRTCRAARDPGAGARSPRETQIQHELDVGEAFASRPGGGTVAGSGFPGSRTPDHVRIDAAFRPLSHAECVQTGSSAMPYLSATRGDRGGSLSRPVRRCLHSVADRLRRDPAGTTAVEFALVAPVFLLLLLGIIGSGQITGQIIGVHHSLQRSRSMSARSTSARRARARWGARRSGPRSRSSISSRPPRRWPTDRARCRPRSPRRRPRASPPPASPSSWVSARSGRASSRWAPGARPCPRPRPVSS